jgi:hypothetical protein
MGGNASIRAICSAHHSRTIDVIDERRACPLATAAKRAAADIEGHSTAAEFGQPGRLSATLIDKVTIRWRFGRPVLHCPPSPLLPGNPQPGFFPIMP